jgi:hypothetical protein
MVILKVFDAMLMLPFASVTAPAATEIEAVPPKGPVAVYVRVRVVPLVVRLDSDPRVTLKSESTKSLTLSLNVAVTVHVLPAA